MVLCFGVNLIHVDSASGTELSRLVCVSVMTMTVYNDNALETLMNMSTFGEHESLVLDISSPANKIRYYERNDRSMWLQNEYERIEAYPGGNFTIHLIALGQTGYPIPARIHWERYYVTDSGYRLSPPSQMMYRHFLSLHSVEFGYTVFKLYSQNDGCQNLVDGLILKIEVLPCPLGFALLGSNSRCICDEKLKILAQNCYIDIGSIERIKNSLNKAI